MPDHHWPEWATAPISILSRQEARDHLKAAQGFWRDFAAAGLTLPDLRQVIEERRRLGPGGKIAVPSKTSFVRVRHTASPAITAAECNDWPSTLPEVPHA